MTWAGTTAPAALARSDSALLRQILDNPHHPAFVVLLETLSRSTHPSVIRLLLAFLQDSRAPSAVLSVFSKRTDRELVEHLLRKIGRQPSAAVAQNLKRIESFAWVREGEATASDFLALAEKVKSAVAAKSGVALQEEIHVAR